MLGIPLNGFQYQSMKCYTSQYAELKSGLCVFSLGAARIIHHYVNYCASSRNDPWINIMKSADQSPAAECCWQCVHFFLSTKMRAWKVCRQALFIIPHRAKLQMRS